MAAHAKRKPRVLNNQKSPLLRSLSADDLSPRGCWLRYVAVAFASWLLAPPCGRRFRLVVVGSASWPWAPFIAVGSASSPPRRGRRLRLLPSTPPTDVDSASWLSAPLDSFYLVTVGFGSSPPPRCVGSARGHGLHLVASASVCLMAIGSVAWRGLCLVTFALWPSASPHRLCLVAWATLVAMRFASWPLAPPPPHDCHLFLVASASWLLAPPLYLVAVGFALYLMAIGFARLRLRLRLHIRL
ncbi:hypothetical protein NL676_033697 [Syzygium grande]|nr:hypothetical protein NL676_033697 [Syzygium grande]